MAGEDKKTFEVTPHMNELWSKFVDKNDEKFARKFFKAFVSSWNEVEQQQQEGKQVEKPPSLDKLPDELLPALSKFLFLLRDDTEEQGHINAKSVTAGKDVISVLIVVVKNVDNIPLVCSMDLIRLITQVK